MGRRMRIIETDGIFLLSDPFMRDALVSQCVHEGHMGYVTVDTEDAPAVERYLKALKRQYRILSAAYRQQCTVFQ